MCLREKGLFLSQQAKKCGKSLVAIILGFCSKDSGNNTSWQKQHYVPHYAFYMGFFYSHLLTDIRKPGGLPSVFVFK
jgi:hypothetical protein